MNTKIKYEYQVVRHLLDKDKTEFDDDFLVGLCQDMESIKVEEGIDKCNVLAKESHEEKDVCAIIGDAYDVDVVIERKRIVLKEDPLLRCLRLVGIVSEEESTPVFYKEIQMLSGVGKYLNLYYNNERIIDIEVPDMGAKRLREVECNSYSFIGNYVSGTMPLLGVRAKIDGNEAVIFNVVTKQTRVSIYWDCDKILKLETVFPFPMYCECKGRSLYILSRVALSEMVLKVGDVDYILIKHMYEPIMYDKFYNNVVESDGVIFDCCGIDIRVPYERVTTLMFTEKGFTDSFGTVIRVQDKSKLNVLKGCYDVLIDKPCIPKYRRDKNVADGSKTIAYIRDEMLTVNNIPGWIEVPCVAVSTTADVRYEGDEYVLKEGKMFMPVRTKVFIKERFKESYDSNGMSVGKRMYIWAGGTCYPSFRYVEEHFIMTNNGIISRVWFPMSMKLKVYVRKNRFKILYWRRSINKQPKV